MYILNKSDNVIITESFRFRLFAGFGWQSDAELTVAALFLNKSEKLISPEYYCRSKVARNSDILLSGGLAWFLPCKEDNERLCIDIDRLPPEVKYVVFAVALNDKKLDFKSGNVKNLRCRFGRFTHDWDTTGVNIFNGNDEDGMDQVPLSEYTNGENALTTAVLIRNDSEWSARVLDKHFDCGMDGLLERAKTGRLINEIAPKIEEPQVITETVPTNDIDDKNTTAKSNEQIKTQSNVFTGGFLSVYINYDSPETELDISAALLGSNGKLLDDSEFVFYNQSTSSTGGVKLENGDHFTVDLDNIPTGCKNIEFSIFSCDDTVRLAYISGISLSAYKENRNLYTETSADNMTSESVVILSKLTRNGDNGWAFTSVKKAIGGGLIALCQHYGLSVED